MRDLWRELRWRPRGRIRTRRSGSRTISAAGTMRIGLVDAVERVGAEAWRPLEAPDFPFFDYEFLDALEKSGSVGPGSGWSPAHLVCEADGRLVGAMPLYLKTDSYGEYVFDWEWAHAYHQNGISYYPKLVAAVPFTPATGPKVLVGPGADRKAVTRALPARRGPDVRAPDRGCLAARARGHDVPLLHLDLGQKVGLPLPQQGVFRGGLSHDEGPAALRARQGREGTSGGRDHQLL